MIGWLACGISGMFLAAMGHVQHHLDPFWVYWIGFLCGSIGAGAGVTNFLLRR